MSKGKIIRAFSAGESRESIVHLALRVLGLDGGPGSGNFNHQGRPGKVGGSGEGGGSGSSKEEYHARVEKMRSEILSKKQNEQAKFADRVGIADRQTCVAAMKNGTASDLVNKYFDIMEENGDPEPTKDLRKSPNINDEVREGKHKVPEDQLWPNDPYTQARIDYIKEWTGMDDDEARETLGEFQTWFGGSWDHADTDKIDRYIDQDGAFDGPIFRGLEFMPDEYDEFMKNAQQGGTIKMIGMNSSWSTDEETARGFAGSSDRCKHVLIKCVKNKTSAPVSHLSTQGEDEVIAHSRAQWTVLSVNEGDRRTEIIVVESEYRMSEDERDRRREQYDSIPEDGYESLKDRMKAQQAFFRADPPSADLRRKLSSEDGGPGSGNFGHKGRPGQRGGSGGGGSAERVRTKNSSETVALVAGKENYMAKPEFQDAYKKWNDAHRKSQELTKEWLDLRRQLDNEIVETPEVKELGRKYADLFDAYTEKGKEIKKRSEEVREEQKAAEEDDKKYGDTLERMTAENRRREKEDFQPRPLTPAKQDDYDGFKLESDVPYVREKLEDGSAWIAEMDPKEYLERCAFQIFNRSSLESTVWAVDTTNVNRYADQMEKGDRFALPYLNFSSGNQEGRHRAVAAMMNGYSKIPVVIVGKRPESMAEDGGPGSGNFGHKGRPGKRGGSGPGGGKQYRGGRSDIGYFSSRKDWLNGLNGEKQHEAVKAVGGFKSRLNHMLEAKAKVEKMAASGLITYPERDEILKSRNLEDLSEKTTPEEYAMRRGSANERQELLGMVKEARSWDETKDRLVKENLSEDEQKIYEAMGKQGWGRDLDDKQAQEALKIKDLLEAKAMGIMESDIETPDEIQYALGTKERPAPAKPDGADYSWYEKAHDGNRYAGNLENYTGMAAGERTSYGAKYTQEEFAAMHQRFLDAMKYGNPSPNEVSYYGVKQVNALRNAMREKQPGSYLYDEFKYTPEMIARLTPDEKRQLLDICNRYGAKNSFMPVDRWSSLDEMTTDDFYDVESRMARETPRSKEAKRPMQDYILLQNKMLTGAVPSDHDTIAENKANAKAAEQKKQEEERKEHEALREKEKQEWQSKHTPEEISKMWAPESVAGVSRNSAGTMSHDDADDGRANPKRDIVTDRNKRGNCQTCVVAYALRRRGYDVEAKLRQSDAETLQLAIARESKLAWMDPETGMPPDYIECPDGKRLTPKTAEKWLKDSIKPGEMHTFEFCWSKSSGAHIIIAEKRGDELVLFDPQPNPKTKKAEWKGTEIGEYLKDLSFNSKSGGNWRPKLMRIDNALPNPDYCDKILQRYGT